MKKIGIVFGGQSEEHEVSLLSATSVIKAIDKIKYQIFCFGITKQGKWMYYEGPEKKIADGSWEKTAVPFSIDELKNTVDFVLPILHGTYGEDGTIQGLLEIMNIPYGGCGVLASALAMDKGMAKELFKSHKLPVGRYIVILAIDIEKNIDKTISKIEAAVNYDMFVKPVNMGSSIGINKVKTREELVSALNIAKKFDRKIIIEEAINCREIETGVMGNYELQVAAVGEIVQKLSFYDYKAKYSDDVGTELVIPALLPEDVYEKVRNLAKAAYEALDCNGFARVDFFVDKDTNDIYLNEINTIPGFTKYSMFPLIWEEAGISYSQLIERIVELGYEKYNDKNNR